jgi:hypothetical protein
MTWRQTIAVWWFIAWRSLAASLLVVFVVSLGFGFLAGRRLIDPASAFFPMTALEIGLSLGLQLLIVRYALRRRYGNFWLEFVTDLDRL